MPRSSRYPSVDNDARYLDTIGESRRLLLLGVESRATSTVAIVAVAASERRTAWRNRQEPATTTRYHLCERRLRRS